MDNYKEKNIAENNHLILTFDYYTEPDIEYPVYIKKNLQYHNSWNSLMPIVNKCWRIMNSYDYDSEIYYYLGEKIFHPDYTLNDFMNNDIESIYRRVVEFIHYYNIVIK